MGRHEPSDERFWFALLDAVRVAGESTTPAELTRNALPLLGKAFDTSLLGWYRSKGDEIEGHVSPGSPDPFPHYLEYLPKDPFAQAKKGLGRRVLVTTDAVDARVLRRSALVNEVFMPLDADRHLVARMGESPHVSPGASALVLCRSRKQSAWTRAHVEALASVLPFFSRVALSHRSTAPSSVLAEALPAIFDRADCGPALVFDADARLIWLSPKARGLLSRHFGKRWVLPARLLAAVHRLGVIANEPPKKSLRVDLDFLLAHGAAGLQASLRLTPIQPDGRRLVVAELQSRATADAPSLQRMAETFALTTAESKVAQILLLGCTNPEIGKRLFISRDTVRTHVRHIFEKLGVHSRFEAISKLGSSALPRGGMRR